MAVGNGRYFVTVDDPAVAVSCMSAGTAFVGQVENQIALGGADRFVILNTAGGFGPDIAIGDLAVVETAVRDDGISDHYLPPGDTVDADESLTETLARRCPHGPTSRTPTHQLDHPRRVPPNTTRGRPLHQPRHHRRRERDRRAPRRVPGPQRPSRSNRHDPRRRTTIRRLTRRLEQHRRHPMGRLRSGRHRTPIALTDLTRQRRGMIPASSRMREGGLYWVSTRAPNGASASSIAFVIGGGGTDHAALAHAPEVILAHRARWSRGGGSRCRGSPSRSAAGSP